MEATREEAVTPAMLLVQELAGDVPEQYVLQTKDRPTLGAAVAMIPVIDLGLLSQQHTADDGGDEASKLRSALESWGIFHVTNHGVEPSVMDAMWSASREFSLQPKEEKGKYNDLVDGEHYEDQHEGYGTEQIKSPGQTSLEWSDRLFLKLEPQDERKLHLWPESLRDILHQFFVQQQSALLYNRLLPAMGRLLGLGEDYFIRQLSGRATTYTRINYYHPCVRPDLVFGIKAHFDPTVISVLMVDQNVSGLQVLKDDVWYDVSISSHPDSLLVIVGAVTEIISNGVFRSPLHRVLTNEKKERTSVVMFYGPDLEKEIGPAEELIDDQHPARYKTIKAMNYLARQYELLATGTGALDTMRI